jgi:alcohol dehydrogenase class IV
MNDFDFNTTRALRIARGGARRLMDEPGCRSALIVSDPGLIRSGISGPALAEFARLRLRYTVYSVVEADPPEAGIYAATGAEQQNEADCVTGFGAGSSMGVAKLVVGHDLPELNSGSHGKIGSGRR